MAAGAHGRSRQLHLHLIDDDDNDDDDVDALSRQEIARRPEVRLINRYAVVRTYVMMALKGMGTLVLLWGTVVLLGGFVSSLKEIDFWYISFIAFVQAAGLFNAMFDNQFKHLMAWIFYAITKLIMLHPSRAKHNQHHQMSWVMHARSWRLKTIIRTIISKVTAVIVFTVLEAVLVFCVYGPVYCAWLSLQRLRQPSYGSTYNKDASQKNLKRGLDLFYFLCVAQGLISLMAVLVEFLGTPLTVKMVRRQVGLSGDVVLRYCVATTRKYFKNLASCDESWNFITYGAALLDSEMPEDNVSGARLLATLIEQGVPVRRLLLRSPRHRIQKLICTLAWRNLAERETRWLAARIVAHVAPDLILAHFPGALECISSLLDTSRYYNRDNGDQEQEVTYFATQLRLDNKQSKQKHISSESSLRKRNSPPEKKEQVISINSAKGTNEDLILQGLIILEILALDEHNCKVICSSDALFSKIIAPLNYESSIEDIEKNTAWAKVTEGSLKLLSRLMRSPGDTAKEMHRKVADNKTAVKNLENVLAKEINSCNIKALQIQAVGILEQLCSGDGESTNTDLARQRRENLITKLLPIFITEDYLSMRSAEGNKEIESHKETVNRLKEKAGEALATLCRASFKEASQDVIHRLTEMLDSEESTIRCRICAALILKHLSTHCTLDLYGHFLKDTTLKKVLKELLHKKEEAQAARTEILTQRWHSISEEGNDIEIQRGNGHNERLCLRLHVQGQKQQREERRLQVSLLSLCAAIRGKWIDAPEFASMVSQLTSPEHLAEKLKTLVEENRYATPSCRATVKLTCELVIDLIPHDRHAQEVKMKKVVVDSLYQASKTMAGLESCMLFAGTEHDCYGVPVKPFCSDLVEEAQELLKHKGQEMGLNMV